jgi:hypothetical protein
MFCYLIYDSETRAKGCIGEKTICSQKLQGFKKTKPRSISLKRVMKHNQKYEQEDSISGG